MGFQINGTEVLGSSGIQNVASPAFKTLNGQSILGSGNVPDFYGESLEHNKVGSFTVASHRATNQYVATPTVNTKASQAELYNMTSAAPFYGGNSGRYVGVYTGNFAASQLYGSVETYTSGGTGQFVIAIDFYSRSSVSSNLATGTAAPYYNISGTWKLKVPQLAFASTSFDTPGLFQRVA